MRVTRYQTILSFIDTNDEKGLLEVITKFHPDARSKNRHTALMYVAGSDKVKFARILLDSGAVVNAQNNDGNTALRIAYKNRSLCVFNLLLERGADPCIKDAYNRSLLYDVVHHNDLECAKILIDYGFEFPSYLTNNKKILKLMRNSECHLLKILQRLAYKLSNKIDNFDFRALKGVWTYL